MTNVPITGGLASTEAFTPAAEVGKQQVHISEYVSPNKPRFSVHRRQSKYRVDQERPRQSMSVPMVKELKEKRTNADEEAKFRFTMSVINTPALSS